MKHIKGFNEGLDVDIDNESQNSTSESDLIFNSIRKILDKKESELIKYMNEHMTQEERNRHGDNISGFLARSESIIAQLKMELMARR